MIDDRINEQGISKTSVQIAFNRALQFHEDAQKNQQIVVNKEGCSTKRKKHNTQVSVTELFKLDARSFIEAAYRELLGRSITIQELLPVLNEINEGMPKECLISRIIKSNEFEGEVQIQHASRYHWIMKMYHMRTRYAKIRRALKQRLSGRIHIPSLATKTESTEVQIWRKEKDDQLLAMQNKLEEQSSILDEILKQLGPDISITSVPPRLSSKGILDSTSYLEQARAQMRLQEITYIDGYDNEDGYYYLFENLFRGDRATVLKRLQPYLSFSEQCYIRTANKPFLDFGCGKGEFLELLKGSGIRAMGVDTNQTNVDVLCNNGYQAVRDDGNHYLETQLNESLSGISLFQVAEHLTHAYIRTFMKLAYSRLAIGGGILIETINPYCYERMGYFAIDPSHITLPSPDALKFLAEYCGFQNVQIEFYAPIHETIRGNVGPEQYEGYCLYAEKTN